MTRKLSKSCLLQLYRTGITIAVLGWLAVPLCAWSATIPVTSLASSGSGSLRTALQTARNGDVITFDVSGTIICNIGTGLTISNNITILGPGADQLTITGTNGNRAFNVNTGIVASISGLTFYQCRRSAINNSGNLTVSNCLFTSCYVGGGINNSGSLMLSGSTFYDCRAGSGASSNPESVPGTPGGSGTNGGALYNAGLMSAINCEFKNNTAGRGGDGASGDVPSFYRAGNPVTTGGSGGNGGHGGAVYDIGTASFTNCTFAWNTSGTGGSGGQGGSGSIGPSPQYLNYPGPGRAGGNAGNAGNGAAVWTAGGARFVSCTFFNNTTGSGGTGGTGGSGFLGGLPGYIGYFSGGAAGNGGNAGSGTLYCTGTC